MMLEEFCSILTFQESAGGEKELLINTVPVVACCHLKCAPQVAVAADRFECDIPLNDLNPT